MPSVGNRLRPPADKKTKKTKNTVHTRSSTAQLAKNFLKGSGAGSTGDDGG